MDSQLLQNSHFHNPVLKLSDENKQKKVLDELNGYVISTNKLTKLMDMFREEMRLGLVAKPERKSVFYMCNTFVTDIPDGTEEGDILSMDLGGTNLRVIMVRLIRGKAPEFRVQPYDIAAEYRTGKSEKLFDFLVDCIQDFITKNPDIRGQRIPFGFTFSFGFDQLALDKAITTQLSLETNLADAVNNDPVQFLREAIAKKGLNLDVYAICNDTTATLMYGMYLKPNTEIGFVLGSGTNTCYLESVDRIKRFDALKTFGKDVKNVIINTECGFLGDDGAIDFVKTNWDKEVDLESTYPHCYGFEKLIGGVFIGDLVRRSLLSLTEKKLFLRGIITEELKRKDSIRGPDVSSVESDETDGSVIKLLNSLGYKSDEITSDDILIVKYMCARIGVRNAQLAAANISAVVQHIDKPLIRVAMDGSVYKKHPKMHSLINDFIKELVSKTKVEIFLAEDGSGKGSAFVAAVAAKHKQQN